MDWEILTADQRQTLCLLADGWLVAEIARKQSTSARAIRTELREIYGALSLRLGRRNPNCAIYKAWVFGEITLPEYLTENWSEQCSIGTL